MLATLADIWKVALPDDAGPDSESFGKVLRGKVDRPVRESLVIQSANGTMTIRAGDWKLITALGSGGFTKPGRVEPGPEDPPGQLYNLADDLGETENLYTQRPDIVADLTTRLEAIQSGQR